MKASLLVVRCRICGCALRTARPSRYRRKAWEWRYRAPAFRVVEVPRDRVRTTTCIHVDGTEIA